MQRVWAAVLSVWATIAIVAVLAWHSAPLRPQSSAQPATATLLVRGANGKSHLVVVPTSLATAPHATTHTSPPAGGG